MKKKIAREFLCVLEFWTQSLFEINLFHTNFNKLIFITSLAFDVLPASAVSELKHNLIILKSYVKCGVFSEGSNVTSCDRKAT